MGLELCGLDKQVGFRAQVRQRHVHTAARAESSDEKGVGASAGWIWGEGLGKGVFGLVLYVVVGHCLLSFSQYQELIGGSCCTFTTAGLGSRAPLIMSRGRGEASRRVVEATATYFAAIPLVVVHTVLYSFLI